MDVIAESKVGGRQVMFVGRTHELAELERSYASEGFEMVVLYGRRRVGKTALLERFCHDKPAIFFTAQLQSDIDNLRDFSAAVLGHFGMPASTPSFSTWLDAFAFLAERSHDERLVIVFDEFPYAARANSALPSSLQVAIDRHLRQSGCMLVLCGSNQGFMEDEVLGEKSPLYGRRTAQIKLKPFDYQDAALMMPACPPEERVSYYAAFGGTPYYLSTLKGDAGFLENVVDAFFTRSGIMFDEPSMLMRQELREPTVYASILRAIAAGANRANEIAGRIGSKAPAVAPYLKTLAGLDLIERVVPAGEPAHGRKSLYRIKDPAFLFWYRFVAPYVAAVESGYGEGVARRLLESDRRNEYEGHVFERVCREWVVRQAAAGALPVQPTEIGSWWGTDPVKRGEADIDVVALDDIDHEALMGECKWRNQINEFEVLDTLVDRCRLLPGYRAYWCYVFTKQRVGRASAERAEKMGHARYVSVDELYA